MFHSNNNRINTTFSKFLILFTIAIVLSVSSIISYHYVKTIRINIENLTEQTVYQTSNSIASYVSDIMQIGTTAQNFVTNNSILDKEDIEVRLSAILESRNDILTINFFDCEGNIIYGTTANNLRDHNEIKNQQWFSKALGGIGNYYFSPPHVQQLIPLRYPWVISFSKAVSYKNNKGEEEVGVLLIDISSSKLKELLETISIGNTGYLYIIDEAGDLVFHPKQTLINLGQYEEDLSSNNRKIYGKFTATYKGETRLIDIQTIDYSRWRIVGVAFINEMIMKGVNSFITILFFVLLIAIGVTILLANIVSGYITSPIRQLEKEIEKIDKNNINPKVLDRASYEVKALSKAFVEMSVRIKSLMEDIVEEQEEKRKSELDALQAKINPHFLYNTLDSVIWLAEQGDDEGVIKLVTALAKLFRISISKGHEIITLKEELEHVKNYLVIQQMRYVDKFEFSIDLPEELENKPTIKLIIQPIVENAIYHGIKYLMDVGHIDIKVTNDTDKIYIKVRDNGVGMDEETRQSLLITDKTQHLKDGNGIGVFNVNKRLILTYGEGYGLSIESEIEEGTTVTVSIPLQNDIHQIKVAKR